MKISDTIRRAGRNLRRAKLRTFLTVVAISIGGFAITASLAAGEGARQYIDRMLSSNIDPQSLMVARDKKMVSVSAGGRTSTLQEYNPNSINQYGMEIEAVTQKDVDQLIKHPKVDRVEPYYEVRPKYVEFSAKKDKKYLSQVMAYEPTIRKNTVAGSLPEVGQDLADDEATIPESYLEALGINADQAVKSEITLTISQTPQEVSKEEFQKALMSGGEAAIQELMSKAEGKTKAKTLKIRAVIGKDPSSMMAPSMVYISNKLARELNEFTTIGTDQYQKYMGVTVIAKKDIKPDDLKEELNKQGFNSATAKDLQGMIFTFVNILQGIVLGFGVLALIVSIFGIVNTQYISVLERTQQIGLMKALGASKRDIARLFRYEAAWVGFFGGLFGVLAAWGIGTAINPWITEVLGLGEGNYLLIFQIVPAILVVVILVLVAIFSGWLPSRKAAKLDPIEALRTE